MKRLIPAFLLAAFAPLLVHSVEVDGVAAIVGTETILKSDVILEMRRLNASSQDYLEFRNRLIDRKLILKAAKNAKVTMQDWVIENRIRDIVQTAFKGDRNLLLEELAKEKISFPEWRSRMKDDMIVAAMRWNTIDKNVTARPWEMQSEYAAHPSKYALGTKVTVSVILLKPEDAAKRDEVAAALKKETFASVALKYSADAHASDGGVWKEIDPSDVFKPQICDEIAKLKKGETSGWVEIGGWNFLIRKDDIIPGKTRSFEEAYEDIEAAVKAAETKRLYDEWIKRLKADIYIKVY